MAVTPDTIVELNDLAKDLFSNTYTDTFNGETPFKAQLDRLQPIAFTGRKWIFAIKTAPGGAAANVGANKSLPAASVGKYDQGEINVVRTYTRMALDNYLIQVTKAQQGSYRPALAETMADRMQAHDLEVNRQSFCAGDGKLALIQTGVASATQTLEKDYGNATGGAGVRHVYEDDMHAIYSSDGLTKRGVKTVTAVDPATNEVTYDSSVTTTTGDFVTKATADTDNFTEGEALGLLASVQGASAANFENIPSAGRWTSKVYDNGGSARSLDDPLVMQVIAELRASSRKLPDLAVTRTGVVLKYSETFLSIRRILGQDIELKGGFKPITGIQHAGGVIPVLEDMDCPDGRLFLLNTSAFRVADMVGTSWFDEDGAQFLRVQDKDAIEGFIRKYWGLATIQRNCNAVIADLDDIATIAR